MKLDLYSSTMEWVQFDKLSLVVGSDLKREEDHMHLIIGIAYGLVVSCDLRKPERPESGHQNDVETNIHRAKT